MPPLPRGRSALPAIEADAVGHRIDLQIARIELAALAKSLDLTDATRFVTLLDVAGIDRRPAIPDAHAHRERGFDVAVPDPDLRRRRGARPAGRPRPTTQAFNRLTEKAVNVRSEARDAYRSLPLDL